MHHITKSSAPVVSCIATVGSIVTADPDLVLESKRVEWSKFWSDPLLSSSVEASISKACAALSKQITVPLTSEQLKLAIRGYSKKKSAGADHWKMEEIIARPLWLLGKFANLLWRVILKLALEGHF